MIADARRRKLLSWGMSAAMAGLVFGYQLAVISGALLFVRQDFGLSSFEQGMLVSIVPLGAIAGGVLAGPVAEALGRRSALILEAAVFIVSTVLCVVAQSYGLLVVARGVVGVGVGAVSATAPLYLSEIAPTGLRGRLVTMNQLMVTLGIVAAYCVGLIFSSSGSWRAMFGLALVPAGMLLTGMLRSPESPAWLDAHGQSDRAMEVLLQVTDEQEAERVLDGFRDLAAQEKKQLGLREALRSPVAPALIMGVALGAMQQFGGINAIIAYAPTIMEKTGLSASHAILASVIVGAVNVVATATALRLVDRAGRRRLLLMSAGGTFASLALLGLSFVVSLGSWLSLVGLLGYVAAFALGLGPVFWLLIAEIFPPEVRATGISAATATVWFSSFLVGLVFLPIADAIGEGPTFWTFAAVCALAFLFVRRYVPETTGRTFSEIEAEVRARWGHRQAPGAVAY